VSALDRTEGTLEANVASNTSEKEITGTTNVRKHDYPPPASFFEGMDGQTALRMPS
jgi:hypothetical protein